jgi:hypothetical protein
MKGYNHNLYAICRTKGYTCYSGIFKNLNGDKLYILVLSKLNFVTIDKILNLSYTKMVVCSTVKMVM